MRTHPGQTQLTPQINDAGQYMLSGAGFGEGNEKINQAYGDATGALQQYTSGSHMDLNDPTLATLMGHIKDDITNQVGGQFAGAGRSQIRSLMAASYDDTVAKLA